MEWEDIYKVMEALAPLYFASILGFGSVKWWGIFSHKEGKIINKFVSCFALPFLTFNFTSKINPFNLDLHFFATDAISKLILILLSFALWETYHCSITTFSHSSLTNSLLLAVPLVNAIYGPMAVDLIVQGSVIQALVWLPVLLFVLELRHMWSDFSIAIKNSSFDDSYRKGEKMEGWKKDLNQRAGMKDEKIGSNNRVVFKALMKKVLLKLANNPYSYSCIIGFALELVAKRWDIQVMSISKVGNSSGIVSKMGIGVAIFNMGLFMAAHEKLIGCEVDSQAIIGIMVLKFIAGPAAMAIASIAMGLNGFDDSSSYIWLTVLLFVLELGRTMWPDFSVVVKESSFDGGNNNNDDGKAQRMGEDGKKDLKGSAMEVGEITSSNNNNKVLFKPLMKKVLVKLATNPNSYGCIIGFAWALVVKRWDVQMLSIVENSIGIMLKMGIGAAMFNMGIMMAMHENLIACGAREAITRMVLNFIGGAAAMAIASIVMGLNGDVLHVAIIQAAIQQPITSFIYAKKSKVHAEEVISTNAKTPQFSPNFVGDPSCEKMGLKKDN